MANHRSRSRARSASRGSSLTASERAYMIRKAKEASVALVDHAHTLDGPVQWHYTGKFRGIQMYRGEGSYDRVGTAGTEFLCGVTTMMGTIEEVANYFDQQTTDRMVAKKAEDVLDCAVLYSLVQHDPQNPFYRVSAKYQLYEGPSAFSRERDYCFLECQNTFRHASGRRGWVLSMHSIKLPLCPEVEGVVRGSMYQSGYVFVEAEKDGYMDVMHSLQINFKSSSRLPHFLLNSALKRRILSVVTISREIQSSRMGRQTLLKKKDLMPKRARALCVNCSRKFSLFVRKTRCRVCGEVVCQPCAPQVLINVSRGPPVKTRVCTKCYHLSPKDEYEPVGDLQAHPGDGRRYQNETRYSDILQDQPDAFNEADEDSLDEDEDEDGLEEQSDYSVFAQSRFTEASRDSVATTSRFDADDGASSIYSGTSTSYWQQESSIASSMTDWHQAGNGKAEDSYIYDPQASVASSNFYGASNFTEDNYGKRPGQYNSTAAIPEDEPAAPTAYGDSYASHGYGDSYASHANGNGNGDSHASHQNSKILSIHQIAKARSARYGISSQFPPPPPPPPLSPPPEEEEEEDDNTAPLDAGSLRAHNLQFLQEKKKDRGNAGSRKMYTPPKEERGGSSRRRMPPKAPKKEMKTAAVNKEEGVRVSHIDSKAFGNTRSSAILQQVRRNRNRTLQFTPESDRSSAVLKSLEEEHLARMREIERMQALAKEKAARRSIASNGSQQSMRSVPAATSGRSNDRTSAAAEPRSTRSQRSSRRAPVSPPGSPPGAPPRSPPGRPRKAPSQAPRTPPRSPPRRTSSRRGHRPFNDSLRRTDVSSDGSLQRSQFSTRSTNAFTKSSVRVSVAPSEQMEDLTFLTNRSGNYRISATPSKGSNASSGSRQFNASHASSIPHSEQDLAFDASQLSLDQSKFSSSIAILETPDDAAQKAVAIMERHSAERGSNASTLFDEDLVNRSTEDLTEHINSIRARNAYKLPDEDSRPSDELRKREEEHRKRMEELARITVGKVTEDDVRDSASSYGGLHDSAVSLNGFHNTNGFSNTSSTLGNSLMDSMVSEDFDFESRPLGRTKRSGTIPFSLDEMQNTVEEGNEEESASDRSSERSRGLSHDSEQASARSSERSRGLSHEDEHASTHSSERSRGLSHDETRASEHSSERSRGLSYEVHEDEHASERSSERSRGLSHDVESERSSERSRGLSQDVHEEQSTEYRPSDKSSYRPSDDPGYRPSDDPGYRPSDDPGYRPSDDPGYRPSDDPGYRPSDDPGYRASDDPGYRPSDDPGYRPSERSSEESSSDSSSERSSERSRGLSHDAHENESEHSSARSRTRSHDEPEVERASEVSSVVSSEDSGERPHEEPVAPKEGVPTKFEPYSSQLVPGEGSSAVDEFLADESHGKLSHIDERHEGSFDNSATRASENTAEENLEFMPSVEEHAPVKNQNTTSVSSTEPSERVSSARGSCVSNLSALDEELMNRPTEDLFEQVRANRAGKWEPTASISELHVSGRSSEVMQDIEESHRRRMEELNRIALDHLGNRISNLDDELFDSSYRPNRANDSDEDDEKMQWRSTYVMDQYQSKHHREMETLRRKIRQLEEECRESFASVLTAEELMDLSELDEDEAPDTENLGSSFNGAASLHGPSAMGSSFVSTDSLNMSSTQPMPPQLDEPVSARVLYEQIAQLTQLQREMAMAEDDADEEEYRARIKEQYRLLRSIKVHGRR